MMTSKSGLKIARPRRSALSLWAGMVLASCHAAPIPEVAPSSPPVGPSDASEASSVVPEPAPSPLQGSSSEPEPQAPTDSPTTAPDLTPSAPSVTPPAEPPSGSPPGSPKMPAAPAPKVPSAPSPQASPKPASAPVAPASPAPKSRGYTGDQPCKASTFHVKAVESACREGGRAAAKDLMKQAVANAKAKGVSLKCTSCHVDQKSYALQPDAVKELARWL